MKKMVILEGVDGSGKTTLASQLSLMLGLPIAERAVTSENGPPPKAELIKWMYRELADETPKIYDRFPIYSDPIYSRVLGRDQNIGPGAVRYFHEEYNPFLILCDPGWPVVNDGVHREVQMPGVTKHLSSLYTQYRNLSHIDYVYDHTDRSSNLGFEFLIQIITDYLEND